MTTYFQHNTPTPKPESVPWEPTGDVEHVVMWTDENGIAHHSNERG